MTFHNYCTYYAELIAKLISRFDLLQGGETLCFVIIFNYTLQHKASSYTANAQHLQVIYNRTQVFFFKEDGLKIKFCSTSFMTSQRKAIRPNF